MAITITPDMPPPKPRHHLAHIPKGKFAYILWRQQVWWETTFCLNMLEPWEKLILITIFAVILFLLVTGIVKYLPHNLVVMQRRAMYYLWGQEGDLRLLWQWLGFGESASNDALSLMKEL